MCFGRVGVGDAQHTVNIFFKVKIIWLLKDKAKEFQQKLF